MICFLGTSHAAVHLREAAIQRHLHVGNNLDIADVIFISEDTPTDSTGKRDLTTILKLIDSVRDKAAQLVLTSQVPPGFTRSLGLPGIIHQAETLRIKDAVERAYEPEYIAMGFYPCERDPQKYYYYDQYLSSFNCPILRMTWEEAEFSKIAVNMALAAQVDYTNRLSAAAEKSGANWDKVSEVLRHDRRIGPRAYLTPGRWQDSLHLLRDSVTLTEIER